MAEKITPTPTQTTDKTTLASGNDNNTQPALKGPVKQVQSVDGAVTVEESFAALKQVDLADVDLLLTFENGHRVVITNGALDALGEAAAKAVFSDSKLNLSDLFKLVGVANPAKAGSLRLVTENIDANPPQSEASSSDEARVNDTPPPAPMVKVSAGAGTGTGLGKGNGAGESDGDVPATVVPLVTPAPAVFSGGRRTITQDAVIEATGVGIPNVSATLFTSSVFKVTPSGRSDTPLGAYDANATSEQLAARSSPAGQSTFEKIFGTAGNDTINFNSAFSASEAQWSKTLHVTVNNFSSLSSIQIVFSSSKIAQIAGFDLVGPGVTRDGPNASSWHITPTADMLLNGFDITIVYDVMNNPTPVDFGADIIVAGNAGPLAFEIVENLNFTYRDVVSQDEFTVTSSTGEPLMVLPSGGVGIEVFAGNGNDIVNSGAGSDLIHAGDGDDTVNAGTGNDTIEGGLGADSIDGGVGLDTVSYENATVAVLAALDTGLGLSNVGEASGDVYVSVENLVGSDFNDTLAGNSQNNQLSGGDGNDVLIGGQGADTLQGGEGMDTASFTYATAGVGINLFSGQGTAGEASGDVYSSIENIIGGSGDDTIVSGAGVSANNYDGQGGTDTISYASASTQVTVTLTLGLSGVVQTNDAAGDTFTSIENVVGSNFDDRLIGNSSINILTGGVGNDTLEGLGGADQFVGGDDSDTVSYENSAAGVTASLTTVFSVGPVVSQTNDANGDTFSSIEHLTGTDFNDTLIGDANSNVLLGRDGDDTLEGMAGGDVLDGGSGNDTASYAHATGFVNVSLTNGLSGFSTQGQATGDSLSNIENLTGSNFDDTLIGDANTNVLQGGDGNDTLEGMAGGDQLIGGNGINTASYEHSPDSGAGVGVTASLANTALNDGDALGDTYSNIQNLLGSGFNDALFGDASNNMLTGGAGNDTLSGAAGTDNLIGGAGDDQLIDDLSGNATLSGGLDNDNITFSSFDSSVDTIEGGDGFDTLTVDVTGTNFWAFNMQPSATQSGGTIQLGTNGTIFSYFSGIENITAAGGNRFYIYANNADNVFTGGTGSDDQIDYRHALGGINVNLATGVVTGGSGSDFVTGVEYIRYGSHFNDVIIGNAANNIIQGGQGADTLDGGAGIDGAYYDYFNSGSVTVSLMNSAINNALGIVFTDTAAGDVLTNFEQLFGSGNSDTLYGDGGTNALFGQNGNDVLEGMAGVDVIDGGNGTDTASYASAGLAAAGTATTATGLGVTATLTTSFAVGPLVINTGDALGDTYVNIENLLGSSFDDYLIGNSSVNLITSGDGNDTLEGLGGADTFVGGNGVDTVSYAHSTAGVLADLSGTLVNTNDAAGDLFSSIENLVGSNFNDTLYGNGSDNILDGGLGTNTLDGGAGNDTANYSTATAALTINLAAQTVSGAGRTDSLVSIERIIASNFVDTITGGSGNDWIDGGVGADVIDGAAGTDTISYSSATSGVTVTVNGANTQSDVLSNFENLYGSIYADILTGDGGNNEIEGNLGDDQLNGSAGSDTVAYTFSSAGVSVNISGLTVLSVAGNSATGGAGTDTLSNFENITGSAFADTLIGDGNANRISADAGDDTLVGGAGADTLTGGAGIDTVSYLNAGSAIAVLINGSGSLGDANGDVLSGIENVIGSGFDDSITGDNAANTIDGGLGNDTINGSGGIDTVTYATAVSAVNVNIANSGANVSGGAGSDSLSNIENIIGSIFADNITGDGAANIIDGGLGNDTLNGGAGTDTVSYANASGAVAVNIHTVSVLGIAANTSSGAAGSDALSNFESIVGSSFNDTLIGGAGTNQIDGGLGDDYMIGGAGADNLIGGLGTDTVSYENAGASVAATLGGASLTHIGEALGDTFSGIENLVGSAFNDTLFGDSANNRLVGGAGNDLLRGYDGNDVIDMTQGNDTAFGGNGDDTFIVNVNSANLPSRIFAEGSSNNLLGGGDTVQLSGLVNGQTYSLANLAAVTDNAEILSMREGVNSTLVLSSANVQSFVDSGTSSRLFIKADSGDTLNISLNAGETLQSIAVGNGMDYIIYNTSSTQVAAIHWQTS